MKGLAAVWFLGLGLIAVGNVRVKENCPLIPLGGQELQSTRGGICYDGTTLDGQCAPRQYTQPCSATGCFQVLPDETWWCPYGTKGAYTYLPFWGHNCTVGDVGKATCPRFDNQHCEWAINCAGCTNDRPPVCKNFNFYGVGDVIWYVLPYGNDYNCVAALQMRGEREDFMLAQANGLGYSVFEM